MNNKLIKIGLLSLAAVCSFTMSAKPAKQGVLTVPTADGSELRVRLAGDEFFHQYLTEDGFPLQERDGNFYYCDIDAAGNLVASDLKATDVSARTASARNFLAKVDKSSLEQRIAKRAELSPRMEAMKARRLPAKAPARAADGNDGPPYPKGYGLFSDVHFPAYGDQKAIVILVEYTDVKFNSSYNASEYFTNMLNQDGFSQYNGTGSAAEYFRLNSGNSFCPEFDVYGPIQLANNQAYYGKNDWYGNDQDPGAMVKEACDELDDIVDFSEYDRDGDGIVDNVFIFYAGRGEASGGASNTVWPHSWDMTSAGYPNLYYDGVKLHTYGCSNEWEDGRPDGVGTFIHEFSHVIGLPDLYATSYTSAFTPGAWSVLDYGPYNNDGCTPPLYGAFERYALGWIKPREVDRALSATLQPMKENVCGIIRTTKDTEFFLLENRQKEGWDAYIPGHGMLIWHVDYNSSVWNSNTVNNSSSHQYVDLEEADNTQSESSRAGDAFPGTGNKRSFTSSTSPAMKMWSGTAVNYPITDIYETGGMITFNVLGGGTTELPTIVPNDPEDVSAYGFKLSWTPVEGYDALLNVYTRASEDAEPVYVNGFQNRNMGSESSVVLEGLQPSTYYYYTMALSSGWETSAYSEEKVAFTGELTLDYYTVKALEAADIAQNSFTARWQSLSLANDYLVTLYEFAPGDPNYDVCDFTNGVLDLGDWTTTASSTYGMDVYCGAAVPSLRMAPGNTLRSPMYDDNISSLSFWHRGNNTSESDLINVYAITAEGQELVQEVPIIKTEGGQTVEITDLPLYTKAVVIEFKRNGVSGYLAIDDVKVAHGTQSIPTPVENYIDLSSEGQLSLSLTGLKANTDYGYTVRATDGERFSNPSGMMMVRTLAPSGISSNAETIVALSISGRTVSAPGQLIEAYDFAGRLVNSGHGSISLPQSGLYLISVPARHIVRKVVVK